MAFTWPQGLPYASTRQGFSQPQVQSPRLRTEMNSGTQRARDKNALSITVQKLAIPFTSQQFLIFDYWYRHTLGNGTANFTMMVWNGSVYLLKTCAIIDEPVATVRGVDGSLVTMTIRIENLA